MASMVGFRNFDNFLKEYVKDKAGKLVNSEVLCFACIVIILVEVIF